MKITTLLMLVFTLQVSAKGFGQKKLNLQFKQTEIASILSTIEKGSHYRFLYDNNLKGIRLKVSLQVKDADVKEVLDNIFANTGLSYQFMDNDLIVIKEAGTPDVDPKQVITGKVTGDNNVPLAGVSVQVKGTSKGTVTNEQGTYTINAGSADVLVFSYVGYESQEIAVGAKSEINAALSLSKKELEQVVVIGYGVANKRDLTGSIVKIAGKDVADKPNTNPVASLQGKVAGLSVVNSGTPGAQPDVRLRGTISIGSVHPIYVVDGILNDNIDFINPNDIESIEVLKDPSSLAIFGVRGAAGVIAITTKTAKVGQTLVNFNSTVGSKKLVDKIKLTNASDFKTLYNEQLANQGSAPFDFTNWTANTDWIDALSQTGLFSTSNISVTGSTDRNKFYMNAGFTHDEGIVKHEQLEKLLLTINDEFKVSKAFKLGFTLNGIRQKLPYSGSLTDARRIAPVASASTINGLYSILPGFQSAQIDNPLMILENNYDKTSNYEYRTVGSVYAEVNFLKNFTFKATGYGDISNGNGTTYSPIIQYYDPTQNNAVITDPNYKLTKLSTYTNRAYKWQQDDILTYKKNFGDHSLTAMAGFTTYYQSQFNLSATGQQSPTGDAIPNDKRLWYINSAFVDQSTVRASSSQSERTTVSGLFRVLYNYQGKYLLNGSFRRDGSSGFANHPWQNFWAAGAAWDLTRENFMKDQHFFDFLKLKGSIGVLGNQATSTNGGLTSVYSAYPSYASLIQGSAVFGNTIYPAYSAQYVPDANLHWETVHAKEIGIEMDAFKRRLHFEVTYYDRVTKDLLAFQPALNGFPARLSNIGSISNKGFEFTAGWTQLINKDLTIAVNANLATLNNKVLSLYTNDPDGITGPDEQYPNRTAVGKPIGFFFGYVAEGVYQNQAEVDKSPKVTGFGDYGPGDLKFKDLNGDNVIDSKDRTMIGNPTPKFTYGASISVTYKGFDLGIDFQGVSGNQIYRYWGTSELTFAPFNYPEWKMNRWHGEGTSNTVPQLNNNHNINSKGLSTFGIENGSYLRLRNIALGYKINTNALAKVHIKSFRVFVSAQNFKTFKHNYGYTPDFGGSPTSFGIDNGDGPVPVIYTGGINVNF